jgi:poly-beta-1,6-N-acetyl-D-glucosamine synthase
MPLILLTLSIIYATLIIIFTVGIFLLKNQHSGNFKEISIIVAARNEEKIIGHLLHILTELDYPADKYEIIIADDRSEDKTAAIVEQFKERSANLHLVQVKEENSQLTGKKGALDKAIRKASNEYLVFTDADCIPPKLWLQEINKQWTSKVDFWAGYSPLMIKNRFIFFLKNLERAAIFAITAGTFGLNWGVTCTARNMGYRKSVFTKAEGFDGIGHIRSGDDDLLLQKMNRQIRKLNFLFSPDSIVWSKDGEEFEVQIDLETRRASKWKYYPVSIKLLTAFVFIYYLVFFAGVVFFIAGNISPSLFLTIILIKLLAELLFLTVFLFRIRMLKLLLVFPLAELIYIPYFIYFGLKGTLGKYNWK